MSASVGAAASCVSRSAIKSPCLLPQVLTSAFSSEHRLASFGFENQTSKLHRPHDIVYLLGIQDLIYLLGIWYAMSARPPSLDS